MPPQAAVGDDEFRCADCHRIFSLDDEHHRSDLAQICPACYDASDDWQCDDCCYLKAGWEPQFEQPDGSVICEGCDANRAFRVYGPPVIHLRVELSSDSPKQPTTKRTFPVRSATDADRERAFGSRGLLIGFPVTPNEQPPSSPTPSED
jgi:hypothetical protein